MTHTDRTPMDTTLIDLGSGAQLTLLGFRIFSLNAKPCPCVLATYREVFGDSLSAQLLDTLQNLSRGFAEEGRRRIRLAAPNSVFLTHDEGSILSAVAAAQAGDRAICDAHLNWLLAAPPSSASSERVESVGAMLASQAFTVAAPCRDAPPKPEHATLHAASPVAGHA